MKKKLLVILSFVFLFFCSSKLTYANCMSYCASAYSTNSVICVLQDCNTCDFCQNSNTYVPGSLMDFQNKLDMKDMNLQKFVGGSNGVVNSTINQLSTEIVGADSAKLLTSVSQGETPYIEVGGLLGVTTKLVASVITPPKVSGIEYFADLGRRIGIAKPAYAQGIGFTQLGNLLPIWKAVRDASYIFFVVVFSVVGLAIMLRVKLDPKTVITIQNAIPKLVIALILITFSYAIAGLAVDLIYVIIFLGVLIFKNVPGMSTIISPHENIGGLQAYFSTLGFLDTVGLLFRGIWESVTSNAIVTGLSLLVPVALGMVLGLIASTSLVLFGAIALPILIFLIIPLVLMIKLLFKLIGVYIKIILLVVTAPFQILMGVFPGSNYGFSSWFRNLLQNILVFPVLSLLILLGLLLMKQTGPGWTPPGLGLGGGFLPILIGLGMLLAMNSVPDAIKAAFEKKAFPFETAIGQALGQAYGKTKPLTKAAEVTYVSKLEGMPTKGLAASIFSNIWGIKGTGEKGPGIKQDTEKKY